MRRCWRNARKKPSGPLNAVYVNILSIADNATDVRLFTDSNTSEDYVQMLGSQDTGLLVNLSWKYNSEWGELIKRVLESNVADIFLIWSNGLPSQWAVGVYSDEAWDYIKEALENPSQETEDALMSYLTNCMETQTFIVTWQNPPAPPAITIIEHSTLTPSAGWDWNILLMINPWAETFTTTISDPSIMEITETEEFVPGSGFWGVAYTMNSGWTVTITFTADSDPTVSASLTYEVFR